MPKEIEIKVIPVKYRNHVLVIKAMYEQPENMSEQDVAEILFAIEYCVNKEVNPYHPALRMHITPE